MAKSISKNELEVVQLLIEHSTCSITELMEYLNVTATAVRQRISRLLAAGLVDRQVQSEGRGRPLYRYLLTDAGRKLTGNNLPDIAAALWHGIQRISDESLRQSIIAGAIDRLAASYSKQINGKSLEERLNSLAGLFRERDIPVEVENRNGTPTLRILSCPYPDLANENHEVCEMEKQLLTQVVGGQVDLCQCRRDGDSCCSFQIESTPAPVENQDLSRNSRLKKND